MVSVIFTILLKVAENEKQADLDKQQSEQASIESKEEADRKKAISLKSGTNHNNEAEAYAYNTQEIQQIIDGKREYDGPKLVFLTFDDGPNLTMTPKILNVLKSEGVHATFFEVGKNISEAKKEVMERQIHEGHAIGVHSYTHDYTLLYPNRVANVDRITSEAQQTLDVMHEVLGQEFKPTAFRYPGGHMSWRQMGTSDQALEDMGLYWIDWNAADGDALPKSQQPKTAEEAVAYHERTLNSFPDHNVRVVLMHDTEPKEITLQALPGIIQYYKDNGYTFGILK